jgi:hypothetical protein
MTATGDVRVLVPAGVLGWGIRTEEIDAGLAMAPHAIAIDAGSTDSGPAYLATGRTKYGRPSIKRDLSILMAARRRAGIPLLIGSCGTSGCDMAVDQTLEVVLEVAREQGDTPRIAVIYSEQSAGNLKARTAAGAVTPLAPSADVTGATSMPAPTSSRCSDRSRTSRLSPRGPTSSSAAAPPTPPCSPRSR